MRFSEFFEIDEVDDWDFFNCDLIMDTKLFINPFQIFTEVETEFEHGHSKILRFFNEGFKLAVESNGNKKSVSYRKLQNMMIFPEVDEIALGYSSGSTNGAGAGLGFRDVMISGIFSTIKIGIKQYEHFEEIGIFSEGIGCDRISDITANIIKSELIQYTQRICNELGIPMHKMKVRNASFDFDFLRWQNSIVGLPLNPYTERPIILLPKRFLDELPTISAEEFWDYAWFNKNETLRNDMNYELKSQASKSDKVRIARENPDWVREFVRHQECKTHEPYNFVEDKLGVYNWDKSTSRFVSENSTRMNVDGKDDFWKFVQYICSEFKLFIEEQAGYKLLWDDKKSRGKKEEASQLVFHGIVRSYCKINNTDISREPNIGRGPVDFKFSRGYKDRVLLEVKLARNGKFWNGVKEQLPQYLKSEEIDKGVFMVVIYTEKEAKKVSALQDIVNEVSQKTGCLLDFIIIDARDDNKRSASKL